MSRHDIDIAAVVTALWIARERFPTGRLKRNAFGNLQILVDGEYVGFIDLADGTFVEVDDPGLNTD